MKKYELIKEKYIEEVASNVKLLKHIKSGARILLFENNDENKVFSVGFRTPPTDDTGVPHILEHSTLCGSKKFPVKDPFIELLKGSLNTFLNAMTYPDKTVYPVASCNDKDFANLMEVYMDAVFYPNVYLHEEIFKQEGWHYELENVYGVLDAIIDNNTKYAFEIPSSGENAGKLVITEINYVNGVVEGKGTKVYCGFVTPKELNTILASYVKDVTAGTGLKVTTSTHSSGKGLTKQIDIDPDVVFVLDCNW